MSLFRKKPAPAQLSAFDLIPPETQAKLIEDVLLLCRTIRAWPDLIPTQLHKPIVDELTALMRKTGLKLVSAFMSGTDDAIDTIPDALKGVQLPNLLTQTALAVKLAFEDTPSPPKDTGSGEDPNGTAA